MLSESAYCQQTSSLHNDYLKKSKRQKTAAWILSGGGIALGVTGKLIAANTKTDDTGVRITGIVTAGVGILSTVASVPLFIASKRNRVKAASLSFKTEQALYYKTNAVLENYPVISCTIGL